MKFSEQWLREWVNPKVDSKTLLHQLTMAGLEVDSAKPVAPEFNDVIVAEVLEVKKHPDADRLNVCQLNIGKGDPLTIVCGASNVRKGLKVALAMIGAVLPGDFKIKKSKIRGETSHGMICSADELKLEGFSSEGIMELEDDAPVGKDFREYLKLDDTLIDIDLTPNRGDCFSLKGIAREVGVINRVDFKTPDVSEVKPSISNTLSIKIEASEACPRYVGRVVKNINARVASPLWLKEKLRRSGVRSIHPVVDVTNYVMLSLGQPMHAFDMSKIKGGICVRMHDDANEHDRKIVLLDGEAKGLFPSNPTLIIADDEGPLALAGIMGGLDSSVTEETTNIFLESAWFNPRALNARGYQLTTDSSQRFERGVSPDIQAQAIEMATRLLLEIVGGEAGPVVDVVDKAHLPKQNTVTLRASRIKRVLGVTFEPQEVEAILKRLGMQVTRTTNKTIEDVSWDVRVPAHRFDISIEVDLIEELARIRGYDAIPSITPKAELSITARPEGQVAHRRLRDAMMDLGFHEAVSYSFVDKHIQSNLNPDVEALGLVNPISEDMSVMRTNLWPGLIKAVLYNQARQQPCIRMFERGLCFAKIDGEVKQENKIAGVMAGLVAPEQWGQAKRVVDFYDLKYVVEELLAISRQEDITFSASKHQALHPGQSADILLGGEVIGHCGALHPKRIQEMKLQGPVWLFELDTALFNNRLIEKYHPISKYPTMRRDLAIVVSREISASEIEKAIREGAGELLKTLHIFDVYQGEGIDSGQKSVALSLVFQASSKTLTDEEINEMTAKIMDVIGRSINATLRD